MKNLLSIALIILLSIPLNAQSGKMVLDKPGTFKVVNWSVHGMSGTDYTKTEKDANYKKLVDLANIIKQNPVINSPLGFDCEAVLYGAGFDKKNGYGIQCNFALHFLYFFINNKGNSVRFNIEPPSWTIVVNKLDCMAGGSLGYNAQKPTEDIKPGFNFESWKQVADKLTDLCYVPGKKETIADGIDRYGSDFYVIYNSSRPAYWQPVTIREAFTLLIDFWKKHPHKMEADLMLNLIEPEYAKYSESEKDGPAYSGGIGGIGSDSKSTPIMRINKEYWNRKLPRSAIQIMSFNVPSDKKFLQRQIEEEMSSNSGFYHISRFLEKLDVNLFTKVIDK